MKLAIKPKYETNEEFLSRIMTYGCPTGSLIQSFVVQALTTYTDMVITAGPEQFSSSFLNGDAWTDTAEWLKQELDKKYGR
jgi:hypothetical protein